MRGHASAEPGSVSTGWSTVYEQGRMSLPSTDSQQVCIYIRSVQGPGGGELEDRQTDRVSALLELF